MKKFIAAILLGLETFSFAGASIPADIQTTDVIITLDLPEGENAYDYAQKCADALIDALPDTKCEYIYDTLLCGFSLKLPESAVTALSAYGFVDGVYSVGEYEPLSYEESKMLAAKAVKITEEITEGLTGDGVKVAVIDNSFDVTHPAFDVSVTESLDLSEYAMQIGIPVRLKAMRYIIDVQKFRYNSKIPFAFDYADHDTDVYNEAITHGTHVAGIIGAAKTDADSMHGIAPGCQMFFMKVFGDDSNSATDSALIAALEDSVRLGADIINLSIGHYSGSTDMSAIGLDEVISKAKESGCLIVSAAGNYGVSTDRSFTELPLASYTDYGTISSPACSDDILAVASVDNAVIYGEHFRHTDGTPYYFLDTNTASDNLDKTFNEYFDGKTLEYEVIPGIGGESDYSGKNVEGKLVLVQRGTITFAEKTNIAASHGAVGVIVYNNVENEYAKMDLTGASLPAISITLEDGNKLISKENKKLSFSTEFMYIGNTDTAGEISYFSSRGTTPSLTLKPDISAIGGSVYSTVNGGYGALTGTSMASPQIAGIYALLTEKSRRDGTNSDIVTALMNSATPVFQSNGVEYSPRAQGAGLVDFAEALDREVEITYAENGKPKAELFDKLGDSFSFDVTIKNLTDKALDVSLGVTLTSDGYKKLNGEYYSSLEATADKRSKITVGTSGNLNRYSNDYSPLTLTLEKGEERTLSLTFILDDIYNTKLEKIFTNGYFIEGYVYCETKSSSVSLPYMGYAGDFAAGEVVDSDAYSNSTAMFDSTKIMTLVDGEFIALGENIFASPGVYNRDTIAFSPNGDGLADVMYFAATHLRNVRGGVMSIRDAIGEEILTSSFGRLTKTEGKDQTVVFNFSWDGGDGMHSSYRMPDGDYVFEVMYTLDYGENNTQTYTYNVKIDTVMPTVTEISYKSGKLTIKAEDNSEVIGICLYEGNSADKTKYMDSDGEATFDISQIESDTVYYEIIDSAYNVLVGKLSLSKLTGKDGK